MDENFKFRQSFDRLMVSWTAALDLHAGWSLTSQHVKGSHTGKRIGNGLYDHFRDLKIEKNLGPGESLSLVTPHLRADADFGQGRPTTLRTT